MASHDTVLFTTAGIQEYCGDFIKGSPICLYHSSNISHFETVCSCLKGYPLRNKRKTAEVLLFFFILESSTRVHKKMSQIS